MTIEGFDRQKRSLLKDVKVQKDKRNATLLLTTDEKGFQFKADAKTDIETEEGDGLLTLKVPHKTRWIVATHPDYGQLSWRAPGKGLRKKKTYHAYLRTYNPDKTYKPQKQWVVMEIEPRNAIVHVDSGMRIVRDGRAQYYLPLGKHTYMVEAPFYETVEDTLELTDEEKLILPVRLQPVYSYLKVTTPRTAASDEHGFTRYRIYVDNEFIGRQEGVSSHIAAGQHRLTVMVDSACCYDRMVTIGASEKTVVELTAEDLQHRIYTDLQHRIYTDLHGKAGITDSIDSATDSIDSATGPTQRNVKAQVSVKAPDEETEIWVDRVLAGTGSWEGTLDEGFHIINSQKDGQQGAVRYLWVYDERPQEVHLGTPQVDMGYLNIHSNVVEAAVYVNDSLRGMTPCIVGDLAAGRTYSVRIEHEQYKTAERRVMVLGNDLVDVEMVMKKK